MFIAPVSVHSSVAGLYSSALLVIAPLLPPATNTFPFGSRVAVWEPRAECIVPLSLHVPEAGS